jgi:hypothetical protein
MSKQLKNTNFEFSKIEEILQALNLSLLIGLFIFRLFFHQGRSLILLLSPITYYWLIYFQKFEDIIKHNPITYKIARLFSAFLCLLLIFNHFLFTFFEFILNTEFIKVNNTQGLNHPIANQLYIGQFILLPLILIAYIPLSKITDIK